MSLFKIIKNDPKSQARLGELCINSIKIPTPAFMPVGTQATIKGLWSSEIQEMDYKIILANTYHLSLRPGSDIIHQLGGLHTFMNWPHILLTDSGGYQVYSLAERLKFREEGVVFQSHIDGSYHLFTPENVIQHQALLGSNINMVLDDCPPHTADSIRVRASLERTNDWARQALNYFHKTKNTIPHPTQERYLFGIVQGGMQTSTRLEALQYIESLEYEGLGFDGIAIGGLSVGEERKQMYELLEFLSKHFEAKLRPRYLMGVGAILDILEAVKNGVDMFDCVLPTRNARNGQALTSQGVVRMRNQEHKMSTESLDSECPCKVCRNYTRGYLHHLLRAKEMLGAMALSYHNLYFYSTFMEGLRKSLEQDRYEDFYRQMKEVYRKKEMENIK